ncbi:hypothetical protein ACP4OV_014609 [Aristida adscensionis]
MAVVLEVLASYVQKMLMEMTRDEVQMLLGVTGEINKMDVKLKDLKNILTDADRRNITDHSVHGWVRELRDAMYEATDILDLCQLKAMGHASAHLDTGCFNPLLFCMRNPLHAHDIGRRIKKLNEKLDGIKERSAAFSFINLGSYEDRTRNVVSAHAARLETTGELDESTIVGEKIEEDTKSLVQMLTEEDHTNSESNKIRVFAIVGAGGIGKTTLAKKIFNDFIIKKEFTKKIWLSVNKDFNALELLRRAITEAGGNHQVAGGSKVALERTLKENLKGHRTLLVMDDVWNHQAWESVLETPLVNVLAEGSRVLVTTRHNMVARGMRAENPYHQVERLNPDDAWSLLKNQVTRNAGNDETEVGMLKDIGMGIIEKCDCLPLAIKVVGGLLRQKNRRPDDWEKVLNDSIWSVSNISEELNYAIYLSYDDLHPYLKQCFLHYSLLPRHEELGRRDIIGMWISEGFICGNSHELDELGMEYYNELIHRNLIEPDPKFIDHSVCNMHDVVRSFGQYVARDEALVAHAREIIDITSKLNTQKFLRLSLYNEGSESNNLDWSSLQAQESLRTLISIGNINIKPGDSMVSFSSLRTLFLYSVDCNVLIKSLHRLKHLRYLFMQRCAISMLPANIGKMKFLQFISVCDNASLVRLPDSIIELCQLRALYLEGTSINNIPRGFNVLSSLRRLNGFPAHMDGEWCSLQELGPLSELSLLGIINLENVSTSSFATTARLCEKLHLCSLLLSCTSRQGHIFREEKQRIKEVFDKLYPPPCLQYLDIEGYFGWKLPKWLMSAEGVTLRSLRIIILRDLPFCTELPDGLCLLPFLEQLQIIRATSITRIGLEFLQPNQHRRNSSHAPTVFARLHELQFHGMMSWEEWEWEEQVQAMPVLDYLQLQECKLRRVPPGLAFHARALRRLYVYTVEGLSFLENFVSLVDLQVFRSPDMERIRNLPKLQRLDIAECKKMRVLENLPALQELGLADHSMETLPGYLRNVNPRHLLLYCNLSLLTSIAAGASGSEWDKFRHIQQVKAYTYNDDDSIGRKRYVLYTRDPFSFETNIGHSA